MIREEPGMQEDEDLSLSFCSFFAFFFFFFLVGRYLGRYVGS